MTADELIAVGEAQNGHRVELRLQQKLRITLPEVRTAGFDWDLRSPKEGVVSLLEDDIQTFVGTVGGTALHQWVLRAEEPGVATIVLEYCRPWERAARPARTFSISFSSPEGASSLILRIVPPRPLLPFRRPTVRQFWLPT
jgi:predicted secreted protein